MSARKEVEEKIDRKARMKIPYEPQEARPVEVRIADFEPTFIPLTAEEAMKAAERCIHCPDPSACVEACVVHNNIPEAMYLIEAGDFIGAAEIYRQTSSMPEICGRVCPHSDLCQGSCVRSKRGEPVLTGALEAFVTDYQRQHSEVVIPKGEPTGKRVAVVGSGPAGLACAERLVRQGHEVSIIEALPTPGGLLIYGIPNFKLPKDVVQNVIQDLENAGVEFVLNTRIGDKKTVEDALILATARRAFRSNDAPQLAPIASLHYLLPIIHELKVTPPDPGYLDYLRYKLARRTPPRATDHQIP